MASPMAPRRAPRSVSAPVVSVNARQVLAFRLQRLGLGTRASDARAAVGEVGLPDYPPGAALHALAPRLAAATSTTLESAFEARQLVRLRAMRGAPVVVRAEDYDIFARGVLPTDEASMRAFIGPALKSVQQAKMTALEAVELATEHVVRALSRSALDRDQIHATLRSVLPKGLLPYCRACKSHHAHPSLMYAVALRGRLVLFPRQDGPYLLMRFDRWLKRGKGRIARPTSDPPAELLRRFLRAYGPASVKEFSAWAGMASARARALWAQLEPELTAVVTNGSASRARATHVLSADVEELTALGTLGPSLARLLSPGDPVLQMRDRDLLVPESAVQKVVWKSLAPAGVVLAGSAFIAVARIKKERDTLVVSVEPRVEIPARTRVDVEAEAARLASVRSCREARVVWA